MDAATAEISDIFELCNDNNLLDFNLSSHYDPELIDLFNKMESCNHLKEFIEEQKKIIGRHLDKHKWYQHIDNKEKALQDFVDKYAWIIREMYCDAACPEKSKCAAYQNYLTKIKGSEQT